MESFVTLLFIKVEGQNLADWGILMCTFQKTIYFFIRHNWCKLERPFNFAIFDGRSPKFCMLYYFDVFS